MSDLINPDFFSSDPTLSEGDVALVFGKEGGIRIVHNDSQARATGTFDEANAANFIMALAALNMVNDEEAFENAMKRTVRQLDQLKAPSPNDTRN